MAAALVTLLPTVQEAWVRIPVEAYNYIKKNLYELFKLNYLYLNNGSVSKIIKRNSHITSEVGYTNL